MYFADIKRRLTYRPPVRMVCEGCVADALPLCHRITLCRYYNVSVDDVLGLKRSEL